MDLLEKKAVMALREQLQYRSDEDLQAFLVSYAHGHAAAALIASMTPEARAGFFASMRAQYPELGSPPH